MVVLKRVLMTGEEAARFPDAKEVEEVLELAFSYGGGRVSGLSGRGGLHQDKEHWSVGSFGEGEICVTEFEVPCRCHGLI